MKQVKKRVKGFNFDKIHFCRLKIDFVLANSENPGEIPCSVAFYQGNQCLQGTRFGMLIRIKGKVTAVKLV